MSEDHKTGAEASVELSSPKDRSDAAPSTDDAPLPGYVPARPAGWMYKGFKVFGTEIWYASPKVQLLMVAFVCFLCPGMFNALSGLGGGGQIDPTIADHAATALYSTFAVVGFFAGTIANRIGLRITLSIGGVGYCIYSASFLSYNITKNSSTEAFVIFAGTLLGVCAGLLWTAQGAIMMSYPPEDSKGRYISWFWIIFNFGAVVGSLVPLGENVNNKASSVTNGTYAAFIVLMFCGLVIGLFLCNADNIIREDGSRVILMKNPSWSSELKGLWETLYNEPWIVLLFPMFFCSNIFYTYQMNNMNGAHFTTRARSLNNLLYWLSQIIGAVVNGYALDMVRFRRTTRARAAFVVLVALTFIIWGGGYAWQKDRVDRATTLTEDYDRIDWNDGGERFIGPMFLYFFYGFYDAIWQTCIYWWMGALSNSSRKAANLTGFYKGIQSAGAAIFWRLDGVKTPFNTIFGATWGTLGASLIIAAPVIFLKIKDHISVEEDLKFSDETIEDVVGNKEKNVDAEV